MQPLQYMRNMYSCRFLRHPIATLPMGHQVHKAHSTLRGHQLVGNIVSHAVIGTRLKITLKKRVLTGPQSRCKAQVQRHKNGLDLQACILQLLVAGACFVGCIFLRPFGAPTAERIRLLLYWPHTSALVAYNGGTSVGHGPVRTLFLEHEFVPSAGTLDVGHGPVRTLFLSVILSLVPMTPVKLCYIGPTPVPWWPIMVALALAMALSRLFFLSLILFPVQAHWM